MKMHMMPAATPAGRPRGDSIFVFYEMPPQEIIRPEGPALSPRKSVIASASPG